MECAEKTFAKPDRIDIERFFQTIAGKLGKRSLEAVTAAMVESVSEAGMSRVLKCSAVDPFRLTQTRSRIREKQARVKLA